MEAESSGFTVETNLLLLDSEENDVSKEDRTSLLTETETEQLVIGSQDRKRGLSQSDTELTLLRRSGQINDTYKVILTSCRTTIQISKFLFDIYNCNWT